MIKWTEFTFILKPSTIGGIGVFTTHDLPAGIQVFSGNYSPRTMKIKDIPSDFLKYCIYINDEECFCPKQFDRMGIGWYLNHSDQPNISKKSKPHMMTLRNIKAGEEMLVDYNDLNEPEHLKEPYYLNSK